MLKIELLNSFIAVAETGNLSKAAQRMCRTQSALSLKIKRLEESVGQTLLERDNRGVTLTDAGEKLLNYAYQLVALNNQAFDAMTEQPKPTLLRIGVPTDYVKWYLESGLIEFIREFTSIQLVIDTDVSGNLISRLNNGEFDAIIATHWQPQPQAELLFERNFVWVGAKNGQAKLAQQIPMALYPENCPIRTQVFANHSISMRPIHLTLSTPCPYALCSAVEADLAIAPIAEFRVNEHMEQLDAAEHNLPQLPAFNESIYINPNADKHTVRQLVALIKANLNSMVHK
ncbi:LysR family transcriptional regulator [Ferrimonas lipolytica]|uniref:LysR family transcriptional regulator n=1 Tax=Ferrimonas lipolytica TaxID=2724191 RepID=A0A6H1UG17_9GAMM|nr:LysR family transcriptional regulator [Ferrimonas lipolytica]QIZ78045.1 LysR family transcriptional regulator [Ferrimonas lipolytica]